MSLSQALRDFVERQWTQGGWLSSILAPLGMLTDRIAQRRALPYRLNTSLAHRTGVPVVVVGNIYVGGTGKTPVVMALVKDLQRRGWHPGVISRGYGRRDDSPRTGQGELSAAQFGDEPALIARETGAPVAVHRARIEAARALRAAYPAVNVIIADDGLQHHRLHRDLDILVQDERGIGNGRLLPAGPLRESAQRLEQVDAIITTHRSGGLVLAGASSTSRQPSVQTHDMSAPPSAHRPRRSDMTLTPESARHLTDQARTRLAELATQHRVIAASAGIGNPGRFFDMLTAAGVTLAWTLPLPDHYDYAQSPFAQRQADIILITEKDAVKCAELGDPRLWAVPVQAAFSDSGFLDWVADRVKTAAAHADTGARADML